MEISHILWSLLIGCTSGIIATVLGSKAIRRDERKYLKEKEQYRSETTGGGS